MKSLARSCVWWPAVDRKMEEMVQKWDRCQQLRNRLSCTALLHREWPENRGLAPTSIMLDSFTERFYLTSSCLCY